MSKLYTTEQLEMFIKAFHLDFVLGYEQKERYTKELLYWCNQWIAENLNNKPTTEEIDRGCCSNCGEGYDNEEEWLYNTKCELCGHPIPEHLIIRQKPVK